MSRHQSSTGGNADDDSLRSDNDLSLHSRRQDPESLRDASNLNRRVDTTSNSSAQDSPSEDSSTSNREPVCDETDTREATAVRLSNTSAARSFSELPEDRSQTDQISVPASASNYSSDDDNTQYASYSSRSQLHIEPTNNLSGGASCGSCSPIVQRPEAARGCSVTECHSSREDGNTQGNDRFQTQPKCQASVEGALPRSSMQWAGGASECGREMRQGATAAACPSISNASNESSPPSDTDLLLIGKTGNGKSATGNSIMRRNVFSSKASASSVTKDVSNEVTKFLNRIIKAVDAPGVGDTRLNTEESEEQIKRAVEAAIACNPRGYHAFLLVLRYGAPFTREEEDAIKFLKWVFGPNFIRDFCILVLTHGDQFELDGTHSTIKDWCLDQEGPFLDLVKECEERVVLFNNVTKDERKLRLQLSKLLELVDSLKQKYRYSDINFKEAATMNKKLTVEAEKPVIHENITAQISLVFEDLDEVKQLDNVTDRVDPLTDLCRRVKQLYQCTQSADKNTGVLNDFLNIIQSLQTCLEREVDHCIKTLQQKEDLETQQEIDRILQEEIAEVEKRYREAKEKNDWGLIGIILQTVSWPLRKIKAIFKD